MAIAKGHKANFNTLVEAIRAGDVALMECELAATGENVAVICAANRLPDGEVEFAPFAMLFAEVRLCFPEFEGIPEEWRNALNNFSERT